MTEYLNWDFWPEAESSSGSFNGCKLATHFVVEYGSIAMLQDCLQTVCSPSGKTRRFVPLCWQKPRRTLKNWESLIFRTDNLWDVLFMESREGKVPPGQKKGRSYTGRGCDSTQQRSETNSWTSVVQSSHIWNKKMVAHKNYFLYYS